MKKFFLIAMVFFLLPLTAWAAEPENSANNPKISVVFYLPKDIGNDPEIMTAATNMVNKKFNPQKYNIAILGRDTSPEIVELAENVKASRVLKKEYAVKYGKDTNSDYVVAMYMSLLDWKKDGWGGIDMIWQIDTNIVNVATDKYIYNKTSTSPEMDSKKNSIRSCFNAFDKDVVLPMEIVK